MALTAIAIGSSLGDRAGFLRLAVACLAHTPGAELLRCSRFYRSPPAGGVARGWFLNAVVLMRTTLSPESLLDRCREIESRLGRRQGRHWGDRVVDIDLLFVGATKRVPDPAHPKRLVLPHPRIRDRAFVRVPLVEVAPWARDPASGKPWKDLPQPPGVVYAVGSGPSTTSCLEIPNR